MFIDYHFGESLEYFKIAIDGDHAEAAYQLGWSTYLGISIEVDQAVCYLNFNKSYKLGNKKATYFLNSIEVQNVCKQSVELIKLFFIIIIIKYVLDINVYLFFLRFFPFRIEDKYKLRVFNCLLK